MIPLRLLGLGLILLGLLYTHAASPDATVGHLTAAEGLSAPGAEAMHSAPVPWAAGAVHGHDDAEPSHDLRRGHGDHHAFEECAVGQPTQGPDLELPCASPLDVPVADGDPHAERGHPSAVRHSAVPQPHAAESPVLRI
ncbi:hypothetical protein [Streptomyces sp. NPDC059063]|uniref:hypothetical protein n=1 Tax=unclassified Streptomyces TaxID=2593676 RepID=UPI003683B87F